MKQICDYVYLLLFKAYQGRKSQGYLNKYLLLSNFDTRGHTKDVEIWNNLLFYINITKTNQKTGPFW